MNTITQTNESTDVKSTLSNTFKLTSMALLFSAAVGFISNMLGLTALFSNMWVALGLFVVAIVTMYYVMRNADSTKGIVGVFAFAGIYGLLLDPAVSMALTVNPGAVVNALLSTAAITFIMSEIAKRTDKDLSSIGKYLMVALLAVIVASVINIFLGSSMVSLMISAAATVIFSLFILYDVNQIVKGGETNYVRAALGMYLNIIGLFIHLLNIMLSIDD
jgi:modulator of FtsH protease